MSFEVVLLLMAINIFNLIILKLEILYSIGKNNVSRQFVAYCGKFRPKELLNHQCNFLYLFRTTRTPILSNGSLQENSSLSKTQTYSSLLYFLITSDTETSTASFVRYIFVLFQLNMYGFHKSRKEPTKNIFSHPNFVKGKPELLLNVRRKLKE